MFIKNYMNVIFNSNEGKFGTPCDIFLVDNYRSAKPLKDENTWPERICFFKFQAIPIIGPAIFSPLSIVVGVVTFVCSALFYILSRIFGSEENQKKALNGMGFGVINVGHSSLNMVTLGLYGIVYFSCTYFANSVVSKITPN